MKNIIKILILAIAFPLLAFSTTLTLDQRDSLLDSFGVESFNPLLEARNNREFWLGKINDLRTLSQNVLSSETVPDRRDSRHIAIYLRIAPDSELTRMEKLKLADYSLARFYIHSQFTPEQYEAAKASNWTDYLNAGFVKPSDDTWGDSAAVLTIGFVASKFGDLEEVMKWAPYSFRLSRLVDLRRPIADMLAQSSPKEAYVALSELEKALIYIPSSVGTEELLNYVRSLMDITFTRVMREQALGSE